jgi:hypothetical protein
MAGCYLRGWCRRLHEARHLRWLRQTPDGDLRRKRSCEWWLTSAAVMHDAGPFEFGQCFDLQYRRGGAGNINHRRRYRPGRRLSLPRKIGEDRRVNYLHKRITAACLVEAISRLGPLRAQATDSQCEIEGGHASLTCTIPTVHGMRVTVARRMERATAPASAEPNQGGAPAF